MIEITPKRVMIMTKLFTEKINVDTLKAIATQLDGNYYRSDTYTFLFELVKISVLTHFRGNLRDRNIENGEIEINGKRYVVYEVNKNALKDLWKKTIYYRFSEKIIEDEHTIVW